jgi:hypothetical protein
MQVIYEFKGRGKNAYKTMVSSSFKETPPQASVGKLGHNPNISLGCPELSNAIYLERIVDRLIFHYISG